MDIYEMEKNVQPKIKLKDILSVLTLIFAALVVAIPSPLLFTISQNSPSLELLNSLIMFRDVISSILEALVIALIAYYTFDSILKYTAYLTLYLLANQIWAMVISLMFWEGTHSIIGNIIALRNIGAIILIVSGFIAHTLKNKIFFKSRTSFTIFLIVYALLLMFIADYLITVQPVASSTRRFLNEGLVLTLIMMTALHAKNADRSLMKFTSSLTASSIVTFLALIFDFQLKIRDLFYFPVVGLLVFLLILSKKDGNKKQLRVNSAILTLTLIITFAEFSGVWFFYMFIITLAVNDILATKTNVDVDTDKIMREIHNKEQVAKVNAIRIDSKIRF